MHASLLSRYYYTLTVLALVALCAAGASARPLLTADPATLTTPTKITVTWTGVQGFNAKDDYIVAYLVTDPSTGQLVKVINRSANASPSAPKGAGSFVFHLLNYRRNFVFKYVRAGSQVIATSNLVVVNANAPLQGHLALTNNAPSEMRVLWNSGSNQSVSLVKYGTDPTHLNRVATAVDSTYTESELCTRWANKHRQWIDPGFTHDALLEGLEPEMLYYYQFGNDKDGWSEMKMFKTGPRVGARDYQMNVIALGDMGTYLCEDFPQYNQCDFEAMNTIARITDTMEHTQHDLLLHIGDLSYAVGYEWTWDQFFTSIEPIATRLPYMVGIGNHEYDYGGQPFKPKWGNYGEDSNGECGVPYSKRLHMPDTYANAVRSPSGLWYSFDFGLIHFVFISTEHNFTIGSEQYNWVLSDLSRVNRTQTPWVIFSGHRPMYYTTSPVHDSNSKVMIQLRSTFDPLFAKYRVNLALWGHVHNYERTCPVNNGICSSSIGTHHVVIGNAGRDLSANDWSNPAKWSVYRELGFGFARFVVDSKSLTFYYIANEDGLVHDTFTIYQ